MRGKSLLIGFSLTFLIFLCFLYLREENKGWSYGVIIDAGSSGSRVFIYTWPSVLPELNDFQIHPLVNTKGERLQLKVEPGLSSYAHTEHCEAFNSIRPLLDFATDAIPENERRRTPLYILATAGLRLLNTTDQSFLLTCLGSHVRQHYHFRFEPSHVQVITGQYEGYYAWLAVNYQLSGFRKGQYAGTLDMGGASIQITFPALSEEGTLEGPRTRNLRGLFVETYLGFGANEARRRYVSFLRQHNLEKDYCLPKGYTEKLHNNVTLVGTGNFSMCLEQLKLFLLRVMQEFCHAKPHCHLFRQLEMIRKYSGLKFYGISEFWYTTDDIYEQGGVFNITTFAKQSSLFCGSQWSQLWESYQSGIIGRRSSPTRMKNQCFKAAWVHTVLFEFFRFPEKEFLLTTTNDMEWPMGAMISILYKEEEMKNLLTQYTIVLVVMVVGGSGLVLFLRFRKKQTSWL